MAASSPNKPLFKIPTIEEIDKAEAASQSKEFRKFKPGFIKPPEKETKTAPVEVQKTTKDHEFRAPLPPKSKLIENPPSAIPKASTSSFVPRAGNAILVHSVRQRGNPVLKHVRNVPWEFAEIEPDFVLGHRCCALFLSLKYHRLKPEYIIERIKQLGKKFALQIILCEIDIPEPKQALRELNRMCVWAGWTLILGWTPEEIARYMECYKSFEYKPPDLLMGPKETESRAILISVLTCIKTVNKSDAGRLIDIFGSLKKIAEASETELTLCPGISTFKAKKIRKILCGEK